MFTAYSITSAELVNGQCVTTSGSPVTLDPPYITPFIHTQRTLIPDSAFLSSALSSFVDYLGFTSCSGGDISVEPISLIPITNATETSLSPTSLPTILPHSSTTPISSAESTSSSASSPQNGTGKTGLDSQAKVGIGVGIFVAVVIVSVFAGRKCLRYRSRKLQNRAGENGTPSEEHQPYLQQKGELEAEEKRKYELQAEERRYELEENEIFEMPAKEEKRERCNLRRQELRGEEHCRELDDLESRSNGGLTQTDSSKNG